MKERIPESELILNADGSIYHLNLLPGQIAQDIITVGDPDRVDMVSRHFDTIEVEVSKREFKTVTGTKNNKRLTVISTGIGTDNIDIVFTELDALVNVDFDSRLQKENHTSLRFYRIGTSGALIPDISVDQIVLSEMSIGLEGLMHYYNYDYSARENGLAKVSSEALKSIKGITPYAVSGSEALLSKFEHLGRRGITVTATGFYGPQGRKVIASPKSIHFLDDLANIRFEELRVTNLEMETAGIYGMAQLFGHQAISINAILANRSTHDFTKNGQKVVANLIETCLELI